MKISIWKFVCSKPWVKLLNDECKSIRVRKSVSSIVFFSVSRWFSEKYYLIYYPHWMPTTDAKHKYKTLFCFSITASRNILHCSEQRTEWFLKAFTEKWDGKIMKNDLFPFTLPARYALLLIIIIIYLKPFFFLFTSHATNGLLIKRVIYNVYKRALIN